MNKYTRTKINGINTILYPIKDVFALDIRLTIKAGSVYEPGQDWGAFHLLEHIIHQGTEKFSNHPKIEDFKEKHGLLSNAFTSGDHIQIWIKAPYYSAEPALELLSQLAFKPIIPEEKLANEISIITQEYQDKWNNPFTRFNHNLQKQVYGSNHPYTRDGLGQPSYVKTLKRSDLFKLHQKYFTANNCQLTIVGKLSTTKTTNLDQAIIAPPAGEKIGLKLPVTKPGAKKLVHREQLDQEQVVVTWPLPGFKNLNLKQRLEIGTAKYLLGGNQNSILNQEIREKHGLAYKVSAGFGLNERAGYFEVRVSSEPKNRQKIIKLLQKLTYEFIYKPIDKNRLSQANAFMDAHTIIGFDSVDNIASSISNNFFRYNKVYLPNDYLKISKTITPKSVKRTIEKYITLENQLIAILTKK